MGAGSFTLFTPRLNPLRGDLPDRTVRSRSAKDVIGAVSIPSARACLVRLHVGRVLPARHAAFPSPPRGPSLSGGTVAVVLRRNWSSLNPLRGDLPDRTAVPATIASPARPGLNPLRGDLPDRT